MKLNSQWTSNSLLIFTLLWCLNTAAQNTPSSNLSTPAVNLDYWEKSAELWQKILQRQILVSAKNEGERTYSLGAGLVHAPVQRIWEFTTNPEKIKNSSRFIKDFKWDTLSGRVEIQIEILMISHRFIGKATRHPDPQNPKIAFQVAEGSLIPFNAELEIRSAKTQNERPSAPSFPEGQSLVRISGWSDKDRSLSWPLRMGLEAMLQRTAGHLREAVENEASEAGSGPI